MFAHELKLYRVHNESGYVCMYVCIMLITLPSCMCIEDNQCTHRKRMTKTIKNALKQILKMANGISRSQCSLDVGLHNHLVLGE